MPKRIEFNGVVHEFPDDFTDDDIRTALSGEPAAEPQQKSVSGFLGNIVQSAADVVGDTYNFAMSPIQSLKAAAEAKRTQEEAGAEEVRGFMRGEPQTGPAGLERIGQQFQQGVDLAYRDPVGVGLALTPRGATRRMGGLVKRGVEGVGKAAYAGGTALLPRTLKEKFPHITETGFQEGISLSRRGAVEAGKRKVASAAQADEMIAAAEKAGAPPLKPRDVLTELRPVKDTLSRRAELGLTDDTPAMATRIKGFAAKHRKGIPLTKAQALKREAQDMADTAFRAQERGSVIKSDEMLTNKALAKGLRGALEQRVPGVKDVNARTQRLMGLEDAAEHAAGTGHILSRLMAAGALGGLGGVEAGALGALLATPGGLSRAGVTIKGVAPAASHVPEAARLAALVRLLTNTSETAER